MNHRELIYPVLIWSDSYVFIAKNIKELEWTPRSQLKRLKQQAIDGKVFILDSDGMFFRVDDEVVISTQNPILKFFVDLRTAPILSQGRKLHIAEFKQQIMHAVSARQKGDRGSDFIGQLNRSLPFAETYRDALNCVPKGM
jgi:hypothetical protein